MCSTIYLAIAITILLTSFTDARTLKKRNDVDGLLANVNRIPTEYVQGLGARGLSQASASTVARGGKLQRKKKRSTDPVSDILRGITPGGNTQAGSYYAQAAPAPAGLDISKVTGGITSGLNAGGLLGSLGGSAAAPQPAPAAPQPALAAPGGLPFLGGFFPPPPPPAAPQPAPAAPGGLPILGGLFPPPRR